MITFAIKSHQTLRLQVRHLRPGLHGAFRWPLGISGSICSDPLYVNYSHKRGKLGHLTTLSTKFPPLYLGVLGATLFLLIFRRGNHFPSRFHHVFVVFFQGKSHPLTGSGGTRGFHGRRNSWTSCKAERLPWDGRGTEWKNWPLLDRFGKISTILGY